VIAVDGFIFDKPTLGLVIMIDPVFCQDVKVLKIVDKKLFVCEQLAHQKHRIKRLLCIKYFLPLLRCPLWSFVAAEVTGMAEVLETAAFQKKLSVANTII
jgi:hypothetical protein